MTTTNTPATALGLVTDADFRDQLAAVDLSEWGGDLDELEDALRAAFPDAVGGRAHGLDGIPEDAFWSLVSELDRESASENADADTVILAAVQATPKPTRRRRGKFAVGDVVVGNARLTAVVESVTREWFGQVFGGTAYTIRVLDPGWSGFHVDEVLEVFGEMSRAYHRPEKASRGKRTGRKNRRPRHPASHFTGTSRPSRSSRKRGTKVDTRRACRQATRSTIRKARTPR